MFMLLLCFTFLLNIRKKLIFFTFIFLFFLQTYEIFYQISVLQRKFSVKLQIRYDKLQICPHRCGGG